MKKEDKVTDYILAIISICASICILAMITNKCSFPP